MDLSPSDNSEAESSVYFLACPPVRDPDEVLMRYTSQFESIIDILRNARINAEIRQNYQLDSVFNGASVKVASNVTAADLEALPGIRVGDVSPFLLPSKISRNDTDFLLRRFVESLAGTNVRTPERIIRRRRYRCSSWTDRSKSIGARNWKHSRVEDDQESGAC